MAELGFELAPDPRDVSEIAGLAVAFKEAGEIAEDAGVALGARKRIGRGEARAVLLGEGIEIAGDQSCAERNETPARCSWSPGGSQPEGSCPRDASQTTNCAASSGRMMPQAMPMPPPSGFGVTWTLRESG